MPRGKDSDNIGGVSWVSRATDKIDATELLDFTKKGVTPPGREVLDAHTITLIDAFREYQIKRKGTITATKRMRVRDLIAKRATKVLRSPDSNTTWRGNLFDALKCTLDKGSWKLTSEGSRIPTPDRQIRAKVSGLLLGAFRINAPPTAQLNDLERSLAGNLPLKPDEIESLKILSELQSRLRVNSGKWPDPALINLVKVVGPIWKEVTGRSLKRTSVDAYARAQQNLFADWLGSIFSKLGLPCPPPKRVLEAVKSLGN